MPRVDGRIAKHHRQGLVPADVAASPTGGWGSCRSARGWSWTTRGCCGSTVRRICGQTPAWLETSHGHARTDDAAARSESAVKPLPFDKLGTGFVSDTLISDRRIRILTLVADASLLRARVAPDPGTIIGARGRPQQKGCVESFNGRLRDGYLNDFYQGGYGGDGVQARSSNRNGLALSWVISSIPLPFMCLAVGERLRTGQGAAISCPSAIRF